MLCSLMRELNVCLNSLLKNNVLCLVNKGGVGVGCIFITINIPTYINTHIMHNTAPVPSQQSNKCIQKFLRAKLSQDWSCPSPDLCSMDLCIM